MKKALAVLFLLVGCGTGSTGDGSVSGDWSYDWQVNSSLHMQGAMNLQQDGAAVTGRIFTPPDYPQQWNWDLAGSEKDSIVLKATSIDAQSIWTLDIVDRAGTLSGIAYVDGSPSVYTFTATR